jgi:hypothetical protein
MAAKLTENDWKTNSAKCKIKSPALQKAIADYEKLDDEESHDELLDAIADIKNEALELKKAKDVTANPAAVKYVAEIIAAAEAEHREVTKDKTEAEKAAKKVTAATGAAAAKSNASGNGEDDAMGKDSTVGKFVAMALHQLKGNQDLEYEFIVCDAKPVPAVMVAKKITATHKTMLSEATGSQKFLHVGLCWFEDGHIVFEPETPTSGLVSKLKSALQRHTGKKHAVRVGDESSEEETAPANSPRDVVSTTKTVAEDVGVAAAKPVPELAKAPDVWNDTCDTLLDEIKALGKAVRTQCANEPANFTKEIDGYMQKLESRIEKFGLKLSKSLSKANETEDAAARKAELNNAKGIIAQTIRDVKPLAAVIDENPFVKTNFTGELTSGLTKAAQAITKGLAA